MVQKLTREELLRQIAELGATASSMAMLRAHSTDEHLANTLKSAQEQRDWYQEAGFEPMHEAG